MSNSYSITHRPTELKEGDTVLLGPDTLRVQGCPPAYFLNHTTHNNNWTPYLCKVISDKEKYRFQESILDYKGSGDWPSCKTLCDLTKFVNAVFDKIAKVEPPIAATPVVGMSVRFMAGGGCDEGIIRAVCDDWVHVKLPGQEANWKFQNITFKWPWDTQWTTVAPPKPTYRWYTHKEFFDTFQKHAFVAFREIGSPVTHGAIPRFTADGCYLYNPDGEDVDHLNFGKYEFSPDLKTWQPLGTPV